MIWRLLHFYGTKLAGLAASHKSQVSFTKANLYRFPYRGILLKVVTLQIDRASMIPQQAISVPHAERNTVSVSAEHEKNQFCNLVHKSESTLETATRNCQEKHFSNKSTQSDAESNSAKIAFKTMLVTQFLEPLFEGYTKSMFGEGLESDMYKSLFSEAVAKSIAKNDGIGIGNYFDDK